jgi:hypothetical protein
MSEVQALRAGETHVFTVPRCEGWGHHIRVNGQEVKPGEQVTTEGAPLLELWQEVTVKVIAKSLVDGRPDLTIDAWEARDRELQPTTSEDADGERSTRYRDLDAEYEHKKFKAAYQVITRKDHVKVRDVGIEAREREVSPSPFVTLTRHLGEDVTSRFAVYNRNGYIVWLIEDILGQNGYTSEDDKNQVAAAGQRYKLYNFRDGEVSLYINSSQVYERKGIRSFRDTLEAIEVEMAQDRQEVQRKLGFFLAGRQTALNAYAMAKKLERVLALVQKIDSKVSTADDKRAVMNYLRQEIGKLEALDNTDDGGSMAPALAEPANQPSA